MLQTKQVASLTHQGGYQQQRKRPITTCFIQVISKVVVHLNKMPIDNVALAKVVPIYEEAYLCTIQSQNEFGADLVDECAIPVYNRPSEFDIPKCNDAQLEHIVDQFKGVFCTTPGDRYMSLHIHYR